MADNLPILTREQILAVKDERMELVAVPEWGGQVWVRNLTGAERNQLEAGSLDSKGKIILANHSAKLVAMAACDDKRVSLFTPRDVEALGKKNSAALSRIVDKARELSGITQKDVEEYTGNSETGQS